MKQSFDQEIREALQGEQTAVPESVHQRTEMLLDSLPEKETKPRLRILPTATRRFISTAACILFVILVVLPNLSVTYAHAMENIPIIGDLVEIFTIRNYFYSDGRHELDAEVPEVNDPNNEQVSDFINKDVNELTSAVIQKFYDDLEISHDTGYGSIYIDYETVTNTDEWFTLKLTVSEVQASSNTYFKFYHIDRTSGTYVTFGDLIDSEDFGAIEQIIRAQMEAEMAADPDVVYWTEDTELGQSITALSTDQNFYFDDAGNLVIVYNKYEVSPGSMGCPEIVISKEKIEKYLILNIELGQ